MLKKLVVTTVLLLVSALSVEAAPLEVVLGLGTVLQKETPDLEETSIVACHYLRAQITVLTVANRGQASAYSYTTTLSMGDSFIFSDGGVSYRASLKSIIYGCSSMLEIEKR